MSALEEVSEGDLVEPDYLKGIFEEVCNQSKGFLGIEGSLLDYKSEDYVRVLKLKRREKKFKYELDFEWSEGTEGSIKETEKSRVRDTFLRAGVARHSNLSHIMERMRKHDDVIIGLDTNVLLNCIITSSLLEEIYSEDFPNWVLFTVPKIAMSEIENKANQKITSSSHPRVGWPQYGGRVGQRALQEIMDLDRKNKDRPAISIMTIGEMEAPAVIKSSDNWWKDSEIRSQFRSFLRNVSFHKGTYFLSQDRVNVMMSGAEGAEGLYLQKPEIGEFKSGKLTLEEIRKLIYELCVQFGEVKIGEINGKGPCLHMNIFWPGKHVSDWEKSRVRIDALENVGQEA